MSQKLRPFLEFLQFKSLIHAFMPASSQETEVRKNPPFAQTPNLLNPRTIQRARNVNKTITHLSSLITHHSLIIFSLLLLGLTFFLFFYRLGDRDLWSSHEGRAAQDA